MNRVRIVGPGRAGSSFAAALSHIGIHVDLVGRNDAVDQAASGVDAVLIATPDRVISEVAAAIAPGSAVVMHCSGASTLDVLAPHALVGSIHPLMALPNAEVGAHRLLNGGWFAVSGDAICRHLVQNLGGSSFDVPDSARTLYHATAAISANHLVALLAQVERLAGAAGVPCEAFWDLARGSFADVKQVGAHGALTGPAARGDLATLDAHRGALPPEELELYNALADAAMQLARERDQSPDAESSTGQVRHTTD